MSLCRPGGSFREGIAVGLAVRLGTAGEKGRGRSGNLVAIPGGGLIYREEEASINSRKGDVGERQKHDREERKAKCRDRPTAAPKGFPC